jgi:hypothetical protein
MTVHADGDFSPLNTLIEAMPGGPMVNLASAKEHVPEIELRIGVVKEPPVSHNPQAHDDPYCTQCRQDVELFSYLGGFLILEFQIQSCLGRH